MACRADGDASSLVVKLDGPQDDVDLLQSLTYCVRSDPDQKFVLVVTPPPIPGAEPKIYLTNTVQLPIVMQQCGSLKRLSIKTCFPVLVAEPGLIIDSAQFGVLNKLLRWKSGYLRTSDQGITYASRSQCTTPTLREYCKKSVESIGTGFLESRSQFETIDQEIQQLNAAIMISEDLESLLALEESVSAFRARVEDLSNRINILRDRLTQIQSLGIVPPNVLTEIGEADRGSSEQAKALLLQMNAVESSIQEMRASSNAKKKRQMTKKLATAAEKATKAPQDQLKGIDTTAEQTGAGITSLDANIVAFEEDVAVKHSEQEEQLREMQQDILDVIASLNEELHKNVITAITCTSPGHFASVQESISTIEQTVDTLWQKLDAIGDSIAGGAFGQQTTALVQLIYKQNTQISRKILLDLYGIDVQNDTIKKYVRDKGDEVNELKKRTDKKIQTATTNMEALTTSFDMLKESWGRVSEELRALSVAIGFTKAVVAECVEEVEHGRKGSLKAHPTG